MFVNNFIWSKGYHGVLPCIYMDYLGKFSTTHPPRGMLKKNSPIKVTVYFLLKLSGKWCVFYHAIYVEVTGGIFFNNFLFCVNFCVVFARKIKSL